MRRLLALTFAVLALGAEADAVPAQEPTPDSLAAAAQAEASRLKLQVSSAAEAAAVATAAEKAGASAVAAGTALEELNKVLANETSTADALVKAAEALGAAIGQAMKDALAAVEAAAKAEPRVQTDLGRLRAARAMDVARKALADGEAALAQVTKSVAAVTAARADVAKAREAAKVPPTEATRAIRTVADAVRQVTEVASQVAAGDLPVTTDTDDRILRALRVRMTGGAIFFNGEPQLVRTTTGDVTTARFQSTQFARASMYLAVDSQPRFLAFGTGRCQTMEEKADCARVKREKLADRGYARVYVDPFLNVRLTAIPVSTIDAVTVPGGEFLKSEKAAQVQFGGVASVNFGSDSDGDVRFHWGLGPIVRVMFQNVTDGNRSIRVWNVQDDLYDAVTGGARFVLYMKDGAANQGARAGWAPVAYVDFMWGQFQNFETASAKADRAEAVACLQNPAQCLARGSLPPKDDYDIRSQRNRMVLEGRLMMRYVYLGLDLNNGSGKDDFRFVSGLTVTLDQFMRRR